MPVNVSSAEILNMLAGTLVARQKYASIEEALRELALVAVRSKIGSYQRRIRKLERKYASDFATFTDRLKGRATPAEEDDWLAWRSAQSMLADWQQTHRNLRDDSSHQ